MDEPVMCARCITPMYGDEAKQGIHDACLGSDGMCVWALCTVCSTPFLCDNGVWDDCGNYHEEV